MKPACLVLVLSFLLAGGASAQGQSSGQGSPAVSAAEQGHILRPRMRPATMAGAPAEAAAKTLTASIRPMPRPVTAAPAVAPAALPASAAASLAVAQAHQSPNAAMPRPMKRPKNLARTAVERVELASAQAVRVAPGKQVAVGRKGSVCGDPEIRGETLSRIGAKVNGCGIAEPVRVTHVAGVRLSQAATVDCPTARALKKWIKSGLEPVYGEGHVVQLQIAGHYVCRTRNHRKGAKISEHGRGKAIDIAGFTFANGRTQPVLRNFDAKMRRAHKAACGIFGTTLGPGSDGMHEDHLHFDTAKHRNGAYCR